MPKCCGIATNGKLLSPQGVWGTTVSPAVCFQDLCVHHHPLFPASDGSITSPYCPCSRASTRTNEASPRWSTGKSTGAREPAGMNLHSPAGQQWPERVRNSFCLWEMVRDWNPVPIIWLCHCAIMEW